MKVLTFAVLVVVCSAGIHFRDLPSYTSGYLVYSSFPSADCSGMPIHEYSPLGACEASDDGTSYIVSAIADSTVTSYWDVTAKLYNDDSCTSWNSTVTEKTSKECITSDGTEPSVRVGYVSSLPNFERGVIRKTYLDSNDCTSYSWQHSTTYIPAYSCFWSMADGTLRYLRPTSCETTGNVWPGVSVTYASYANPDCTGSWNVSESGLKLACNGNTDESTASFYSCSGGDFSTVAPTMQPTTATPSMNPTSFQPTLTPGTTGAPTGVTATSAPTAVPTVAPTFAPTPFPTHSGDVNTGFVVSTRYSSWKNCSQVQLRKIYKLNACMPDGAGGYMLYAAYNAEGSNTTSNVRESFYSDSSCHDLTISATHSLADTCRVSHYQSVYSYYSEFPTFYDSVYYSYYNSYDNCNSESGTTSNIWYSIVYPRDVCIEDAFAGMTKSDNNVKITACYWKSFAEQTHVSKFCNDSTVSSFNQPLYTCPTTAWGYLRSSCNFESALSIKDRQDVIDENANRAPKDAIYTLFLLFLLVPCIIFALLKVCHKEQPASQEPATNRA